MVKELKNKRPKILIIKRDGTEAVFNKQKICTAVRKANKEVKPVYRMNKDQIIDVGNHVEELCSELTRAIHVEEIQDMVERSIMHHRAYEVAQLYIRYRYEHELKRKVNTTDEAILSLIDLSNEEVKQENSNKNPTIVSVQRDYMAGEVSKDLCERFLLPTEVWDAHISGEGHFHDSDYFAQHISNCCLVNLEDMLQNGTCISGVLIEKPHSFATACNVATQIVAQVASSQYGGQSITLTHLAPFVDISRRKIRANLMKRHERLYGGFDEDEIEYLTEEAVLDEIRAGMQTIQYQVTTLMTTNGQAPFITVFMYLNEVPDNEEHKQLKHDLALLIEEMLKQRIKGVKNKNGKWVAPAFPKLIYVTSENNIYKGTPYYYLTELAAKCSSKRMVPDYISEKKMMELKGDTYPCMGCRSFLTPDRFTKAGIKNIAHAKNYIPQKEKYYGRFNQGVYTMNLAYEALDSHQNMTVFWQNMERGLDIAHKALQCRHERLKGTVSDVAPILWQDGALARLKPGETIDSLLFNGYSTISLGYAGLYECTKYMTGHSHTDEEGKEFALKVMQTLNDACAKWKAEENIDYSVYGTPLESTTYKFSKALQKKFGIIDGITDHNYITNSYHVNVREEIDAFTKLKFEAKFQNLSPGGAISYVEIPNMQHNLEAVISIIQYMYENIMYAELNTKIDYCTSCNYEGELEIVKTDKGKLIWKCPNCNCIDQDKLNPVRRTCGYIGTQKWNQGRTEEIKDRILHVGIHTCK